MANSILDKASSFLIRRRWAYLALAGTVSIFMLVGALRVTVRSTFSDLLPLRNPIVEVFKRYRNFSTPLTVQLLVEVKQGTVYNPQTLGKIYELTRDVDLLPNVDHEQIISMASTKARAIRPVPGGILSLPVMPDYPPKTQQEADEIKQRAEQAAGVVGIMVSPDGTAALVQAAFLENGLDYLEVFNRVRALRDKYRDTNTVVHPAGFVMLVGWIYKYGRQALAIFALAFFLIALALFDYMRSFAGSLTPLIAAATSVVWGVGAGGWLGIDLDPLIIVVPVLLLARGLSHSVQMTRRYYELLYESNDQNAAAAGAFRSMASPATLGVLCDTVGLYLLYLVPIPMIRNLAIFCGTWSLLLIPAVVILTPVLLAVMPPPKDVAWFVTRTESSVSTRVIAPLERVFLSLIRGKARWATLAAVAVLAVATFIMSINREVGNVQAGSSLLWPRNEYNLCMRRINEKVAGTTVLNVIWHGKKQHALASPEAYASMQEFQRRIEAAHGAVATLSFADYLSPTSMIMGGGFPKWWPVDTANVSRTSFLAITGRNVKDVANLADSILTDGTVTLWYKDLKSGTLVNAMKAVKDALVGIADNHPDVYQVEIAAGPVAQQYATDQTVAQANDATLARLLAAVFVLCALTYFSGVAPLMLITPLLLAQFTTDAVMYLRGVGLDINTLPVVAVGVGVGIDYGIYLLSRMCEEYQRVNDGNVDKAIERSLRTVGESTFFVAFTMVIAVLPWYFFSELRFLAEMGLMLALIMAFNAVLALSVLPLEVALVKPRFLGRVRLMERH